MCEWFITIFKAKEIYQVCLEAQLAAQAAAKPGMRAFELDKIARLQNEPQSSYPFPKPNA